MTTPIDGPYGSCTLPAADLPGRLAEFDAAFAAGLRHAEVISPTHARLVFTADQARAEALAGLLGRESECCSFFTFGQQVAGIDALDKGVRGGPDPERLSMKTYPKVVDNS